MFSIITPVYNEETTISSTITSVINQTFTDFEWIIVNDGSNDGTLEVLNQLKSDKRIIIRSIDNSGPSVARNIGLDIATGKYILFVDGDDIITLNLLEELAKYLAKENIQILYYNREIMNQKRVIAKKNKNIRKMTEEVITSLIVSESINSIWGKVYLNQVIQDNDIKFNSNLKMGEDLIFNLDYIRFCKNINFANIGSYIYKSDVTGSLTNVSFKKKYPEVEKLHSYLESYEGNPIISNALGFIKFKNKASYLRYLIKTKNTSTSEIQKTILDMSNIDFKVPSIKWFLLKHVILLKNGKFFVYASRKYRKYRGVSDETF